MTNYWRALKWSLSISGGALGLWYLKDPTRRPLELLELSPSPSDRLGILLGWNVKEKRQELPGQEWRSPLVLEFCEKSEERPRSIDPDINEHIPPVNAQQAIAQIEVLEEDFAEPPEEDFAGPPEENLAGPVEEGEEEPLNEPLNEPENFEPSAPLEQEIEDLPLERDERWNRRLGPSEHGDLSGPAGILALALARFGPVPRAAEVEGADEENAAARRVAEEVVRDVIETARGNLADRASSSNVGRGAGDEAGSSGNAEQEPLTGRLRKGGTSPGSTPKKQRKMMAEESEDEKSSSSG